MSGNIQAIRGMHDILPEHSAGWQYLEGILRNILHRYGYHEIRTPVLEKTELFKRSIGEVTDIVEKEMYTFDDRNGDSLTLRPEGTASTVRAALEHGLLHNQTQRLWYMGPMFRHERPQKGRYRQFYQMGVEVFGLQGPDIDAEMILLSARMLKELGLFEDVVLHINSLGTAEARHQYRDLLVEYFNQHHELLDEDSRRRLHSNPLRILDSKNPAMQEMIEVAPKLAEHLDEESREHFDSLLAMLDDAGINYVVNPRLVRGLDYYSKTVFEWVTESLGAQGTVCAGGRFDGLVEQLGGKATPAIGFAMGMERILALLEDKGTLAEARHGLDAYLIMVGDNIERSGIKIAEQIRDQLPEFRLLVNHGGGSFKSQMKRADKSGARYAFILGDDEVLNGMIAVKDLQTSDQQHVKQAELVSYITSLQSAV